MMNAIIMETPKEGRGVGRREARVNHWIEKEKLWRTE